MANNRSRTEIVSQILEAANDHDDVEGVTHTTLMYEVMLSSAKLKEYLIVLTAHDLLSYERTMDRYSITGKGLQFLEIYDSLGHMIEDEDKGEEEQQQI
jgi:predicted transcriptional regulator